MPSQVDSRKDSVGSSPLVFVRELWSLARAENARLVARRRQAADVHRSRRFSAPWANTLGASSPPRRQRAFRWSPHPDRAPAHRSPVELHRERARARRQFQHPAAFVARGHQITAPNRLCYAAGCAPSGAGPCTGMPGKVIHLPNEAAQLRADLDRLRKEYATFALEVSELALRAGFEAPGVLDDSVGELMKFWRHEIGECARCQCRAPLADGVCAWGCEP